MKFVIRRAVVSVIAMPVVAGAYVMLNAVLIGLGAEPTATASECFITGLFLAGGLGVLFTFGRQLRLG
jgi:hypothetical protein